jgi:hypothetical protein
MITGRFIRSVTAACLVATSVFALPSAGRADNLSACRAAQARYIASRIECSTLQWWDWAFSACTASALDDYMNQCGMNP